MNPDLLKYRTRFIFSPDGGGASPDAGAGDTPDIAAGLKSLLQQNNNDAMALAAALYTEKYQDREKARAKQAEMQKEIDALRERVPPEGAIVLSGAQAKELETYRSLGTPESLGVTIRSLEESQGELRTMRRAQVIRDVATATGWSLAALQDLEKTNPDPLEYEIKDGDGGTKTVIVKVGDQEKPLQEYIAAERPALLPALTAGQGPGNQPSTWPQQIGGPGTNGADAKAQIAALTKASRAIPGNK